MKLKNYLKESSLSRILKHLQDPESTFAVISAYNYGLPFKENEKRNSNLKQDVHSLKNKIGYIELKSKWQNLEGEYEEERFLFINNISKIQAKNLGKKYKQQTILWKDKNGLIEIEPSGKIIKYFTKDFTVNRKDIFSALKKGTQKRLNFTFKEFKIEESNDLSNYNDALNYYDNGPGRNWDTIYEEI